MEQEVNAKKSMSFATDASDGTQVKIERVNIPPTEEFRSLGVGMRLTEAQGTGPVLGRRICRTGELLSRTHGGSSRKAEAVATLVLATGLFGWGG
mmetsp:Transcript_113423/g.196955  ORF Transcript_113423/g.196955 Transcript_113423/m.196955 type:complete len:95 (+) Transcript_113423:136-420(+)